MNAELCVVGEPFCMLDMALWAVHYVIVTAILLNVELVHDWTMSWDECWLIHGCGIAWGDPVIDHENWNCFLRLVEWLLPFSHFVMLLECNAPFAIVRWFHCSVNALSRLLANHQGRLPRIYLLYTENVDNTCMWKGSKLCQTILGLVSKLLHPLSVLLTIVLSWVLYHVAVCAIHIAPNSILWGFVFVKADVKQAEQQESALGLSMSWVMSGRACWNQFAYLRHIREKVMFDPRAWS